MKNDELVGIITTSDMLNVLLEVMGVGTPSSRIELSIASDMGEISNIAGIVKDMGLSIISMVSTLNRNDPETRFSVLRVNTDNILELCKALRSAGYKVTTRYEDRAHSAGHHGLGAVTGRFQPLIFVLGVQESKRGIIP